MPSPSRSQRAFAKFVESPPLLVAQQANLSHNERIDTLSLQSLAKPARGKRKPKLDIGGSLVSAQVTLTIEGASTLTLGIHDPDWEWLPGAEMMPKGWEILEVEQQTFDNKKREKLLQEAHRIILEDAPAIPLWNAMDIYAHRADLLWTAPPDEKVQLKQASFRK
jgi:hypothetical protein